MQCFGQILQNRLDCPKPSVDASNSVGSFFDIVDCLGEELGALESSRGNAYNMGWNVLRHLAGSLATAKAPLVWHSLRRQASAEGL